MTKPLVSLLMPAYNGVSFIKAAIDSVKNQTYDAWEIIVVDDGSTDGTWELAAKLSESDTRIKVIKNDKNLGVNRTRRIGSFHCSGEYIGHLDCDDTLERWALEEMLRTFASKPDVALVYSDMAQMDEKGNITHYDLAKNFDSNNLHQHGWRAFGMYRRDVLKYIYGYNDQITGGCEDGDLFMQIAERYPCYHLAKILYFRRYHGNNMSLFMTKCDNCNQKPKCNFWRVWDKSAKEYMAKKPAS